MKNLNLIKSINDSVKVLRSLKKNSLGVNNAVNLISKTLKQKKKILICGNGGSASQAEHFSTEFLVRLNKNVNRKPYPIIPLALNNSHTTACSNDYSFRKIFTKTLKAIGNDGDCLIALTTSGTSKNIIDVLKLSKKMKINSIGFFGKNKIEKLADINLFVNSQDTARIQESHLFLGHYILNKVEKKLTI
jgi:D-sedoheptulose 7-phosphate isomerase